MKNSININSLILGLLILFQSCVSKKDILYLQDLDSNKSMELFYVPSTLQVDDILDITVETLVPEASIPYNKNISGFRQINNIEVMKLEGYLVSSNKTINFPVLGAISVDGKTTKTLEEDLKKYLESGGYLIDPTITVRLINAKVTILGEVKTPGTFTFTENNITFLQALGLAGDLNINGNREDIILIRTTDGLQTAAHINLTNSEWLSGPFTNIQPNDVIVVNPNGSKIKSAAFFGNASSFVAIASLLISTAVLINNINN